jgi:hydroxymethylpyrimidine pyrophosphatase-like HAD family hydrolase
MLGVDPVNMACVGDSYNDLPMFRVCGLPIAMGGAPEEIQRAVRFTVPSVEEDGLAFAIDSHILPQVG